jgi:hypothetical protein
MMMSLVKLQQEFTLAIAELINYATMRGYGLTFGDAYRDPRAHGEFGEKDGYSASKSVHKKRLAVDFNLFVDGNFVMKGDHPAYVDIGEQWEKMHEKARWGGRFKKGDANHFSFEWKGYK